MEDHDGHSTRAELTPLHPGGRGAGRKEGEKSRRSPRSVSWGWNWGEKKGCDLPGNGWGRGEAGRKRLPKRRKRRKRGEEAEKSYHH